MTRSSHVNQVNRVVRRENKKRKRKRYINRKSCLSCRKQHRACNGERPCDRCVQLHRDEVCLPSDTETINADENLVELDPEGKTEENVDTQHATEFHVNSYVPEMVYGRDPQYFDQVDSRNENEMLRREISRIKEIISSFQQRLASQHQQTQDSPTEISSQSPINDPLTPQMESPSNPNDEWDEFPPDFFYSRGMTSCCRNMCPKSMDRLHQNIWNPDMSQLFAKCNRMSIENEQFHQENLVQQQDLGFPVPIVNARSILRSLGVSESNFNLKRNLYAEVVVRKGIVRLANPEFLALIRAPIDEVIGMSIRDIIPKGFEQYISYVLHREMMASGKTSLLFECICGRKDGTCFRSFVNWTQFHDDEDRVVQEIMAFHLCSVEDLDVPPVDVPIEKTKPPLSLESEYPDSPCTGD